MRGYVGKSLFAVGESRYGRCSRSRIKGILLLVLFTVVGRRGEDDGELGSETCIRAEEMERGRGDSTR